jgi:hypothetical protein
MDHVSSCSSIGLGRASSWLLLTEGIVVAIFSPIAVVFCEGKCLKVLVEKERLFVYLW